MAVHELTDNNDDGSRVGQDASEKVGYFGATPVTQQTVTQQTTATTTALRSDLDSLGDALSTLGLITLTGGGA